MTKDDIQSIVYGFKDNEAIYRRGIEFGGRKFIVVKAEAGLIHGLSIVKEVGLIEQGPEDGMFCFLCKQSFIVGHYAAKHVGEVAKEALKLRESIERQSVMT